MRLRRPPLGLPILLVFAATLVGTMPVEAARKVTLGVTVDQPVYDPHQESSFNEFTAHVGGIAPRIWTLFSKWGEDATKGFPTSAANWVRNRGAVPMIFWEPYEALDSCGSGARFSQVKNGGFDGYIKGWADAAAAYGGKVLLRYAHEINGAFFPWGLRNKMCGNTAADFRAAWKRVYGIFKDEGATNVKFLWTVSNRKCKPRRCNPYKAYYPGNSVVDYVGFSAFNWGRHSGHSWQSMPYLVGNVMGYFKQFTKKPVIIAELASNKTGGNKAAWIKDGYAKVYNKWPQIKAIVYLNVDLRYIGHPDWSLGTPSTAYPAYKCVASAAKFKGHL